MGYWNGLVTPFNFRYEPHVTNIDDFIWRMCGSYRKLNGVTKPFQYPIPRCDDTVTVLNVGSHHIWIITLDACQGYHQVAVRPADQEKIVFFAPDNHKYCFSVMPCVPTHAPTLYSAMMRYFKDEWEKIFIIGLKHYLTSMEKPYASRTHLRSS